MADRRAHRMLKCAVSKMASRRPVSAFGYSIGRQQVSRSAGRMARVWCVLAVQSLSRRFRRSGRGSARLVGLGSTRSSGLLGRQAVHGQDPRAGAAETRRNEAGRGSRESVSGRQGVTARDT